jgi:hypothetical protein
VAISTVTETIQLMLTDHFLDTYVAHKLSALTECGAPELSLESQWLNRFIINSALYQQPADKRAFALNFIRRAEGAVLAYREAREALLEFIREPRNVISLPIFGPSRILKSASRILGRLVSLSGKPLNRICTYGASRAIWRG